MQKGKPCVAGGGCCRWLVQFGLTGRKTPQLATVILADGAVNQVPVLSALRDLVRPPDGMTEIRMEMRAAGVMEPRHHHAPHSIGGLQRAMARNMAIQLQRPTWHLCWTSVAAWSSEDRALSASASPPSLVRIGPPGIVHEQSRELAAAVLTSRRGLGDNSIRFRGRFWSASSPDRPAEDVHTVVPADTRGAACHYDRKHPDPSIR